jgi:phosphatidylserine decarboxylase precursor
MATNRSLCWKLGAIVLFFFSVSFALAQTPGSNDGPATRELKRLVTANPEFKRLLVASIEQARQVNPDRSTNPAQSLEQYYEFISWAERALPGDLLKQKPEATLYQRLDQSLGYLYYICDQPLDELKGKGFFNNSLQYVEPFASWNRFFVRSWAAFLNSPKSWNDDYLCLAKADTTFGLGQGWYEAPSHWKTFNQFFARRLKSTSQRPIAARTDNSVLVSPVDAVPQGIWAIDNESRVIEQKGIAVKTGTVQSVAQLIGDKSKYKDAFAGGIFTHLFLDVGDYHHYHFPLSGIVKEVTVIPGSEVAGGYVTWDSVNRRYAFDPSSIGWQSLETRGFLILDTEGFGLVALLPIGMSPVSSVNFNRTLKDGVRVHKGDELGHFLFGGSDFVMVFQAGVTLTPDSPRNESGVGYSHVLMGERLGELRRVSAVARASQ